MSDTKLSPPWIRGDFSGIADGLLEHGVQRLAQLLTRAAEEAIACGMKPFAVGLALNRTLRTVEAIEEKTRIVPPVQTPKKKTPNASTGNGRSNGNGANGHVIPLQLPRAVSQN